jgi:hydrogenase nickel incorporation protein HypA/HybF
MRAAVHELALVESMIDDVSDQLAINERVAIVVLEIGELAGVSIDVLRFAFAAVTPGTPLAGAALSITTVAGRARCRTCGAVHALPTLASPCPCGSFDRELLEGAEIRLKEVEVC